MQQRNLYEVELKCEGGVPGYIHSLSPLLLSVTVLAKDNAESISVVFKALKDLFGFREDIWDEVSAKLPSEKRALQLKKFNEVWVLTQEGWELLKHLER